jgi:hypothetical protein
MPQYAYVINGQRHLFEGPDPQTTAQFAQRWAAAHASAQAAAANDNRLPAGPRRGQFAVDLGARAKQDLAGLTGAIDQVRAHPSDLLNGPKILGAVSRYIPNALGLIPAAGVDQLTGPVIRGINTRFGSHFDPRRATDQILNGAGLLLGAPEALGPETSLARAGEAREPTPGLATEVDKPSQPVLATQVARRPQPTLAAAVDRRSQPIRTTEADEPSHPVPPTAEPQVAAAYTAPTVTKNVLGQNAAKEAVVPLSDGFMYSHRQRMEALQDLPDDVQDKYESAIADHIIDPILDDPEYHGHNAEAVQDILHELHALADEQRAPGGSPRLADALDAAHEDFRAMVNEQQPQMALELGLSTVEGAPPGASPDASQAAPAGRLLNFAQYVRPPAANVAPPSKPVDLDQYGEDIGKYLRQVGHEHGPQRIKLMLKAWKDMDQTVNDNTPQANWAGKVPKRKPIDYPLAEDFEPPFGLRDTLSFPQKLAWMKTAANDNGPPMAAEDLQNYLTDLWGPPKRPGGVGGRAPGSRPYAVWTAPPPSPTNAFAGTASNPDMVDSTTVPSSPPQVTGLNFNALRPPRWFGPVMAGAASQAQGPAPQN